MDAARSPASPRVVLVRHGEAGWQRERAGDLDSPLTDVGHEQARLLADWLAAGAPLGPTDRLRVGALRTSPLKRARQTADHLAAALELPVESRAGLAEAPFHVVEELPKSPGPFEPPAPDASVSERYLAFRAQAAAMLRELADDPAAQHGGVLAVTHGGLIKTLLRVVTGGDLICFKIYNASITILEWRDGLWRLVQLNLWDHLPVHMRTS